MKLNDGARFPHPMLTDFSDDFLDGSISWDANAREVAETGRLSFFGDLSVNQKTVKTLIDEKKVGCGLFVTCLDTFYSRFFSIEPGEWSVEIESGEVKGLVQIRPVLFVKAADIEFQPSAFHPDFGLEPILVVKHTLIGAGDELQYFAGLDKLVPLESVFKLEASNDMDAGSFAVSTEEQAIKIRVCKSLYQDICDIRNNFHGKQILLSSLYLPVLTEVLDVAIDEQPEERRWYRAIKARCEKVGVELDDKQDILKKAQILLDSPIRELKKAMEGLSL